MVLCCVPLESKEYDTHPLTLIKVIAHMYLYLTPCLQVITVPCMDLQSSVLERTRTFFVVVVSTKVTFYEMLCARIVNTCMYVLGSFLHSWILWCT